MVMDTMVIHTNDRPEIGTNTYLFFYSHNGYVFDNFSAFEVQIFGVIWKTAEHAYQAAKYQDEKIRSQIQNASSPHEAKKIGANKQNLAFRNPEWSEMKMDIMEQILRAKLSQHKYIQEKLLESGTHILVEDSPTDAFWGRGPDGNGENQLGKIWMRLRAELLGITNTKSPLG